MPCIQSVYARFKSVLDVYKRQLLDDAKMDIQDLPDPTIGKLELRDYGYTAEDMVPLRKEAALDYHRMGSKIYCLGSDGSKGEYASKEMIQVHDGLFGMELQMWERIKDNNLDYVEENLGAFQEPMSCLLYTSGSFNVYDDLKQKLIAKGVPEKEIAFIHDAKTEAKKTELFGKVKSGQVRFLIGSPAKMGAGTNVQDRLIALHHLDIGWKPSDLERGIMLLFRPSSNEPLPFWSSGQEIRHWTNTRAVTRTG